MKGCCLVFFLNVQAGLFLEEEKQQPNNEKTDRSLKHNPNPPATLSDLWLLISLSPCNTQSKCPLLAVLFFHLVRGTALKYLKFQLVFHASLEMSGDFVCII